MGKKEIGARSNVEVKIAQVKAMPLRKGKNELLQHLEGGKPLTAREAIIAKCYECENGYDEGAGDCGIATCPLHDFTPYREGGPRKSRTVSDEQRRAAGDRLRKAREAKG